MILSLADLYAYDREWPPLAGLYSGSTMPESVGVPSLSRDSNSMIISVQEKLANALAGFSYFKDI